MNRENIIFIISLPRSGSTLLQKILGSHSHIHTVNEPWIMLHPLYALKDVSIKAYRWSIFARIALNDFLNLFPEKEDVYIEALRAMADVLYSRVMKGINKPFFLDKTPHYYLIIPELIRVFPEARFIFLYRNPMAIFTSLQKIEHSRFDVFRSFSSEILSEGPRLIFEGKKLIPNALTVNYENLVTKPNETMQQLYNELGLHFEVNTLQYSGCNLVGGLGDKKTLLYKQPEAKVSTHWVDVLKAHPEVYEYALTCLNNMDPTIWSEFGYDLKEVKSTLKETYNGK